MLLKNEDKILRVLERKNDQALVISCTQKGMTVWINQAELSGYTECLKNAPSPTLDDITPKQVLALYSVLDPQ